MFQFPHLPSVKTDVSTLLETGYPIRAPPVKLARQLTEDFRSLATPFIGPWPQGIHRKPLIT